MSDWTMELMQGYGVSSTDYISGISTTRRATQSVATTQSGDRVSISEEAMRLAREMLAARQQAEADAAQEAGTLTEAGAATGDDDLLEGESLDDTAAAAAGGAGGGDSTAKQVEELEKKIEQLQQQIAQVEQGSTPDGVKESITRPLYQQINELQQQINELQAQAAKQSSGGGGGGGGGGGTGSVVSFASLGKSTK
ncbi:FlxA-like family protein [Nitratidesulfovibrio sp.]|uniref:FlxA-like family protein n=1 Tax=Nitratidesulfovibrio sp. TaxID=2802297 RepID=UPI003341C83D